jgi:IstB-like ATP binding protein
MPGTIAQRPLYALARMPHRRGRRHVIVVLQSGAYGLSASGLGFLSHPAPAELLVSVVTTNLAFAEWVTVFAGDEKLTTALLDRLAHHATVITTKGKCYRMRKRRGGEPHRGGDADKLRGRGNDAPVAMTKRYPRSRPGWAAAFEMGHLTDSCPRLR